MAIHDHTVRIRPSVPPDGTLTPSPGDPSHAGVAWPESLRPCTRGDIALAVLALTRLRYESARCRQAQALGFPGRPLDWPLSGAVMASLGSAIQCLQKYARLLGHEQRVNAPRVR
jgi:hypothetical protein